MIFVEVVMKWSRVLQTTSKHFTPILGALNHFKPLQKRFKPLQRHFKKVFKEFP
jgi:hypothetical protein